MTGKFYFFAVAAIAFVIIDSTLISNGRKGPENFAGGRGAGEPALPIRPVAVLPQETNKNATLPNTGIETEPTSRPAIDDEDIPEALQGDFKTSDIAAATAWAEQLHIADWLGPLAPLALSPFFGVACLSGLALWGPEWITDNALLNNSGPLCSVPLFAVFAILALLTSLPRLSKVSKPFAQAMDRVEAYAVVIILLAIKLSASYSTGDVDNSIDSAINGGLQTASLNNPIVFQAGIVSFTAETLLMIAMAINLLVINSVKFFFEFLVWLTPFPTVDAIFEICNKAICATLMSVYAFSPTLATMINLFVLLIALIIFRWTARRVKFYRTMLLDPVLARLWKSYAVPGRQGLVVFPQDSIGPFPAKSCLRLVRQGDAWSLVPASSWSPLSWMPVPGGGGRQGVVLCDKTQPRLVPGWLTHTVEVRLPEEASTGEAAKGDQRWTLTTSRRHDEHFNVLVETLSIEMVDETPDQKSDSKVEFA